MIYHAKRNDKDYYPIGCVWWGGNDTEIWYLEKDHLMDEEIDESAILYCGYDPDENEKFLSEEVSEYIETINPCYNTYLDFFIRFTKRINSPWSYEYESYTVYRLLTPNGKLDENYEWVCEYNVVGYDEVASTLYGYGHTKEEAIDRIDKLFDYLQNKYNPEKVSF